MQPYATHGAIFDADLLDRSIGAHAATVSLDRCNECSNQATTTPTRPSRPRDVVQYGSESKHR
jgi:hypothetical protein